MGPSQTALKEPQTEIKLASSPTADFHVNEAAMIRKIDRRIVPTLFFAYFLQFLDKVVINVYGVSLFTLPG